VSPHFVAEMLQIRITTQVYLCFTILKNISDLDILLVIWKRPMSHRFGSQTPGTSRRTSPGVSDGYRVFNDSFDDIEPGENDLDNSKSKTYLFKNLDSFRVF
jgi:hypothetical protein